MSGDAQTDTNKIHIYKGIPTIIRYGVRNCALHCRQRSEILRDLNRAYISSPQILVRTFMKIKLFTKNTNMVTVKIFDNIFDKTDVTGISTIVNFVQKWITIMIN
jgi:hypothetical protein